MTAQILQCCCYLEARWLRAAIGTRKRVNMCKRYLALTSSLMITGICTAYGIGVSLRA